jgi:ATP-dependent Clp protease ATP-binding subunit ClpC
VSKQAAQQRRAGGKFERFTKRAQHVVVLAQERARALKHNYIGTEHVLLGLLRVPDGLAAQVLSGLGIDYDRARGTTVAALMGYRHRAGR